MAEQVSFAAAKEVAWRKFGELGAVTKRDVIDALVEAGASPKVAERQADAVFTEFIARGFVTEAKDSDGSTYYRLSKPGERERQKWERRQNAPTALPGELYEATVTIELTAPSLAGSLPKGTDDAGRMEWPRDAQGRVLLLPVWWKGMFRKVFERQGTVPRWVADWLMFEPVALDVQTDIMRIPVPPAKPGQGGQGVSIHETLPMGTKITVRGIYPGLAIPPESLAALWRLAGMVGFSPGKSKLGYGTFRVLDVQMERVAPKQPSD